MATALVCSVLSKVLVAVLMLLVMGLTGYIVWVKVPQQGYPERYNVTATFNGKKTNFTAPRNGTYFIYGKIFKVEQTAAKRCDETFSLQKTWNSKNKEIVRQRFCQHEAQFVVDNVELVENGPLIIELNCDDMILDEAKSFLKIYEKNFGLFELV